MESLLSSLGLVPEGAPEGAPEGVPEGVPEGGVAGVAGVAGAAGRSAGPRASASRAGRARARRLGPSSGGSCLLPPVGRGARPQGAARGPPRPGAGST